MRYRKGNKGLYYKDGKLENNYHNQYNCNIFQAYILAYQNIDFKYMWHQLRDAFFVVLSLLLLPLCGILFKLDIYRTSLPSEAIKKFKLRYPKNYYEELD